VALADQRKLDAVVRVLGIEDSEDNPSEVCRRLLDSNEELRRSFNSILIDNSRLQERVQAAESVCQMILDAVEGGDEMGVVDAARGVLSAKIKE
jgi:hypothetical protein